MISLYQELKKYNKDKIYDLKFHPKTNSISYIEHGRTYKIIKISNTYFLYTEGLTASDFEGIDQIRDFIIFGLI